MLEGIDILMGDPANHSRAVVDCWVSELQDRLQHDVETDENAELANLIGRLHISRSQARLLRVLSCGRTLSKSYIASRISNVPLEELTERKGGDGPQIVTVQLSKMRYKLPASIRVMSIRGVGYQCSPETCAKLKEIMSGKLNQSIGA